MDTSETYIKMCEKAEEIQALRKNYADWICIDKGMPDMGYVNGRFWFYTTEDEEYSLFEVVEKGIIWLPRQDQLQEMVGKGMNSWEGYAYGFGCWCLEHYKQGQLGSMEQLWLAFLLAEKYGKYWNGENWVKES